jgi:predicted phosphodiesterase
MRRLAIISDIHGNLICLNTILVEIEQHGVDQIICLGDVAASGPQPQECLARLEEIDCPVVMGNTDEWLLNPQRNTNAKGKTAQIEEIDLWCAAQLGENERAFIRLFAHTQTITLEDGVTLLGYHGSPRSNLEGIHPDTPEEEIIDMIGEHKALIMAGGHTHNQMMRHVRDKIIINCGSVGLPCEKDAAGNFQTPHWAEFALVAYSSGRVSIDLRRIPVDVETNIAAIQASAMPHKALLLAGLSHSLT